VQVQPRAVEPLGHCEGLVRGGQQLGDPVRRGEVAAQVARHGREGGAARGQRGDVLGRPVPDLHLQAALGDALDAVGERQVEVEHFCAGGKYEAHRATAFPVSTLSMAARAMASAVRAAAPGTGDGPPLRTASTNAVSSPA
jgi:hypothetical protein